MIRFHINRTTVLLHPLLILPVTLCILFGKGSLLIASFIAWFIHETGHILCASFLHISISEIEFGIFGGIMQCDTQFTSRFRQFFLSFAGPLANAVGYAICYAILQYPTRFTPLALLCLRANLLLLLVNLLPVLPLDGGQMLCALFHKNNALKRFISFGGIFLGLLFIALSVLFALDGYLVLSPAFAGCCLMYSAAKASNTQPALCIHRIIAFTNQLHKGHVMPVRHVAALGNIPLCRLASQLPNGMAVIHVLDECSHHEIGTISHAVLCEKLLDNPAALLRDVFAPSHAIANKPKL